MRLLLVEDEKETAISLKEQLEEYYVVETADTGNDGEYQGQVNEYDLIILDYMLPDIDGIQVCRKLRRAGIRTPIVMLTGQFEIQKKVAAFDSGVDDYVTKAFHFDELLARVRALLRRQANLDSNILTVDSLTLDLP